MVKTKTPQPPTRGTRYMPSARECALLLLHLIEIKEAAAKREFARIRVYEVSLRRLWCRQQVTPDLIRDVNEWLLFAGRALFFAGTTYAIVRTSAVDGWPPMAAKRARDVIDAVTVGDFDFSTLEHLIPSPDSEADEAEESDE